MRSGAKYRRLMSGTGSQFFDLRTAIPSADWSENATYPGCYDCIISLPGDVKMLGNVWADDEIMVQVSSAADVGATVNRAYVSDWTAASATLTVNVAADPRISNVVYRYSSRLHAVNATSNGQNVRNVSAIGNGHQDGAIRLTGTGARVTGGTIRDMNRHGMLVGANAIVDRVTFIRGRNDLEGSTSNSVICNQPTITGGSFTVRYSRFDGSNGSGFTGPYAHGSTTQLLATANFENNIYRTMSLMHDACAQNMQIINADAQDITDAVTSSRAGAVTTMHGTIAGSTINRALNMTEQGEFYAVNETVSIPSLAEGFWRSSVSSAACTLGIEGGNYTVQAEANIGSPSHLIYWVRGTVTIDGTTFGPALGCPVDALLRVGVGQTGALASASNVYPIGSSFQVNGATYNTLGELQAATFDTGSVEAAIPAPAFSDDFNRANGNLDGSTGWTRVGGSANQLTISSNALAAAGATQTLYHAPDLGSGNHYVKVKVAGVGTAGPLIVVRASDQQNFIGLRWSSTGYQFQACVAGSFTTDSEISAITPGSGDELLLVARGDVAYAYLKPNGTSFWRRLFLRSLATITGASTLNSNGKAGLVPRNATRTPWLDDFSAGLLDAGG